MLECVNSTQLATRGEGDVELSVHPEESSTEERSVRAKVQNRLFFQEYSFQVFTRQTKDWQIHVQRQTAIDRL